MEIGPRSTEVMRRLAEGRGPHLGEGSPLARQPSHHEEQIAQGRGGVREARRGRRAVDLGVLPVASALLVGPSPRRLALLLAQLQPSPAF